jgi:hypothetical protein
MILNNHSQPFDCAAFPSITGQYSYFFFGCLVLLSDLAHTPPTALVGSLFSLYFSEAHCIGHQFFFSVSILPSSWFLPSCIISGSQSTMQSGIYHFGNAPNQIQITVSATPIASCLSKCAVRPLVSTGFSDPLVSCLLSLV